MMNPIERYRTDVAFKTLVDLMEHHIHIGEFTPSEMRLAAVMASINYEFRRARQYNLPEDVENGLMTAEAYLRSEELKRP